MNKTILITGASGNLGHAAVEKFTSSGYTVIATTTPGKVLPFATTAEVIECDLTDEKATTELISGRVAKHGSIHAGLLLVGAYASGGIKDTNVAALKKMFAINFETAYNVARPLFLQMQKQATGGRIVLIGSRPSLVPNDGKKMLGYALAKASLFKLAEFLNAEGASQNIVTSVIVPSTIDTLQNRAAMPNADFSKWVPATEICDLMEMICSEKGASLREPIFKVYGNS